MKDSLNSEFLKKRTNELVSLLFWQNEWKRYKFNTFKTVLPFNSFFPCFRGEYFWLKTNLKQIKKLFLINTIVIDTLDIYDFF